MLCYAMLQSFLVLFLIPLCVFGGLKLLAVSVVAVQEAKAKRKLALQVTA